MIKDVFSVKLNFDITALSDSSCTVPVHRQKTKFGIVYRDPIYKRYIII